MNEKVFMGIAILVICLAYAKWLFILALLGIILIGFMEATGYKIET